MKKILFLFALFLPVLLTRQVKAVDVQPGILPFDEDAINLYCLCKAYPEIDSIVDADGQYKYVLLKDGSKIPYSGAVLEPGSLDVDIKTSMAQVYPLEPQRPDLPQGFSPGRKRSYALLAALYGTNREEITKNLVTAPILDKKAKLSARPALALARANTELEQLAAKNRHMRDWLLPSGGFNWRRIAGENVLSPHSWGIAFDIGVSNSPYWRWSKKMPHPLQKSYPPEIVEIMERHGFIWGGKWHEYDLMHFEYRPELLCKARLLSGTFKDAALIRPDSQ